MATESVFLALSNDLADVVAAAAPSVVQVQGRRRPVSGIVYGPHVVVATARALGRDERVRVRAQDGVAHDAELVGWDPASGLVVLRVEGLTAPAIQAATTPPRVGSLAVALARSWSNAITASVGNIAVIGGPLATSRRGSIDEVIRTTAPMHEGFSGGAFVDAGGRLAGVTTAAAIRGLGVVIPAAIAWRAVAGILEHGTSKRGYLGLAGQTATLPEAQRTDDRQEALLVVGLTHGSPAAAGGVLVGDLLLDFDGQAIRSADDLLDRLTGDRIGRSVSIRVLRGTASLTLSVTIGERPS
jgi:S1-C subfamily serine protease